MKNLVSIVIPVYNGEKTLKQCLASVLEQNYKNYEVIVIDNNSKDRTKDIIKSFQKKDKRVRYILKRKRGRGAARNEGIKKAKGEIILTTDSDCIVPENWIKELIKTIIYENEYAVMGSEKDLIKGYWTKNIQKADLDFLRRNINGKYISHIDTKNFAIRTKIMKKLMFDPAIRNSEDFDLYLRLKKIAKIRFLPNIKVGHVHKSSFLSVIGINFNRTYWTVKIYRKYKNVDFRDEVVFESISFKNFLLFPFWMILQFIKRPIGEAFFLLISETSWRAGLLWSVIRK